MSGSASVWSSRGNVKRLFDLKFHVEWTATVRVDCSKLCEGTLECEVSNADGEPHLDCKAYLRTPVSTREHHGCVLAVAEGALKDAVLHAIKRFAEEFGQKGMRD